MGLQAILNRGRRLPGLMCCRSRLVLALFSAAVVDMDNEAKFDLRKACVYRAH